MVNAPARSDLAGQIVARARREGFAACGFASAKENPLRSARLEQWLGEGHHGSMEWMAARAAERSSPQGLWPAARSVIALGMSYAPAHDPLALERSGTHARISVYAQGRDYHDVVKKRLKALARWLVETVPGARVKVFVDTAPVMEKPIAEAAGIGWQGKHTNLVSPTHGSWLFLGAIYTTLELAPAQAHRDQCGTCRACLDACPTQAFPAPYRLDARRCISYLTIEHKGPVPQELREAIGNRIYGCDDCLAVCPWNKFAHATQAMKEFLPRAELVAPRLGELLALDDAGFRVLFSGSPIKRIGRNRFIRNCLYAAGNSGNPGLVPPVAALTADPDPVVAEAAQWALGRLDFQSR
ncbi:MAG: tRNA epoxyqueuosine(34) reductase QueG [Erythrobacter sp.]